MLVYLRDGSAQTILLAATLRWEFQIKLSTSPSHSMLTQGRRVPALNLWFQVPGRVAIGVPIFMSLVWLDQEKSRSKRESNPGSSAPEADALTTTPTRRVLLEAWLTKVTDKHERTCLLSEQTCPQETLACCRDVDQPTNSKPWLCHIVRKPAIVIASSRSRMWPTHAYFPTWWVREQALSVRNFL